MRSFKLLFCGHKNVQQALLPRYLLPFAPTSSHTLEVISLRHHYHPQEPHLLPEIQITHKSCGRRAKNCAELNKIKRSTKSGINASNFFFFGWLN